MTRSTHRTSAEAGFTLIELSIVLVIIGLIIGGVLVGQNLIKSAQIRATIGQYEALNTAFNAFRAKYGGWPGDTSRATTFFTFANVANGDGNGLVQDNTGTTNFSGEVGMVFPALSATSMIGGTYTAASGTTPVTLGTHFPLSKHGRGGYFVIAINGYNQFILGANTSTTATILTTAARSLTPEEAYTIDDKTDDGLPNSGIAVAVQPSLAADATVAAPRCITATTTAGVYAITDAPQTASCILMMRMN